MAIFLFVYSAYAREIPAFPGAEGHGRYTVGGRGGRVIKVAPQLVDLEKRPRESLLHDVVNGNQTFYASG